jgi:hypothetical protein
MVRAREMTGMEISERWRERRQAISLGPRSEGNGDGEGIRRLVDRCALPTYRTRKCTGLALVLAEVQIEKTVKETEVNHYS